MYRDIRRICQDPTEEDRRWFPDMAGMPWLPALHHAMQNFKDESFVGQFLSPKLMRDMRLFAIHDDASERELLVSAIHDEDGYRQLRQTLSQQYDLGVREPNIQVWNVNLRGDRCLTLRHTQYQGRPLADDALEVLKHVARLWGFGVRLETVGSDGELPVLLHSVPAPPA
jgi:spore cortex formation protein SpoVR/YcgB (stage V sporulation)